MAKRKIRRSRETGAISDIMALGIIIAAAALVAFQLPVGSGLIVGAVALFACGLFAFLSTDRRGRSRR